ncbi:MAG: MBL fold metallo-hydrolase [Chloroflexi bacterium]|nr:MBL fold metallo-hydrolase [Chloroflexota bacterium]
MKLKQIFPDVYQLGLGPVNVFFIKDGPEVVVVDASYKESEAQILAAVEALGYAPTAVKNILVTHGHPDHAGSLAALQKATGATVWMHHLDAEVARGRAPWVRPSPHRGYSAKFCSASSSKALTRITQRPKLPKNWQTGNTCLLVVAYAPSSPPRHGAHRPFCWNEMAACSSRAMLVATWACWAIASSTKILPRENAPLPSWPRWNATPSALATASLWSAKGLPNFAVWPVSKSGMVQAVFTISNGELVTSVPSPLSLVKKGVFV